MKSKLDLIDFSEAEFFYKNPNAFVDYSQMQSFSLIKSSIEVFAYYKVNDFYPEDIKAFFEKIEIIQKKNNRFFIPSAKKVSGVLDCCLVPSSCFLSCTDGCYRIEKWNTDGYRYETETAHSRGYI